MRFRACEKEIQFLWPLMGDRWMMIVSDGKLLMMNNNKNNESFVFQLSM